MVPRNIGKSQGFPRKTHQKSNHQVEMLKIHGVYVVVDEMVWGSFGWVNKMMGWFEYLSINVDNVHLLQICQIQRKRGRY